MRLTTLNPRLAVLIAAPVFVAATLTHRADVPLASLDLTKMRVQTGGGRGGAAQTVAQANKSIDGNPIRMLKPRSPGESRSTGYWVDA